MPSYSHDADIVVYNYTSKTPKPSFLPIGSDVMDTEEISLRDAIVSIQCNKTKSSPVGTFGIVLKPTQDWAQVIVPGSWCAIYMSDSKLTEDDYSNTVRLVDVSITSDDFFNSSNTVTNAISPLKMVGLIMSVRIQKRVENDGTNTITYTINGYDFGYIFTSSIYINMGLQPLVGSGKLAASFKDMAYATDSNLFGNPSQNVKRVLNAWSKVSGGAFSLVNKDASTSKVQPPSIRMKIPKAVGDLLGAEGEEALDLITTCIGVDKRTEKVIELDYVSGEPSGFSDELIGEKGFDLWKLILQNTLWGMINEYLNPILNEAYCDLHIVSDYSTILPNEAAIKPFLIVRQIPFNTPNYKPLCMEVAGIAGAQKAISFPVTILTDLPKVAITSDKVISFDIGYSEYERVNFFEINGFLINGPEKGRPSGQFNALNPPAVDTNSISRMGLRPRTHYGADYGVTQDQLNKTELWRPMLVDWWFNGNRFASGTIECIGLSEHIAIGENVLLVEEEILGHIESYTHTFTVDSNTGNRIFRTNIEFIKGVSSASTSNVFKFVDGEVDDFGLGASVGGDFDLVEGLNNDDSVITDDVYKRTNFTEISPSKKPKEFGF